MADQTRIVAKLTQGSVSGHLFSLGAPMMIGLFAVIAFNLIDTYFVAQLGTLELAAMSFTFPVATAISSFTLGLGIGASSVIARAIGHGDRDRVKRLTTDSLLLACGLVGVLVLLGFLTIDPLFTALGATEETLPLIREYMEIWYLGIFFLVVPMVGNSAIRATGDTKFPAMVMVTAAVVNIALDPLLIFGHWGFPRLEIKGAAIATVIARAITLIASLLVLIYRERLIAWVIPPLKVIAKSWKEILRIGLPAAANNMITPISIGVVTRLIADYGQEAVAAFGIATRIESFSLIAIYAAAAAVAPIVGQNWGAHLYVRVRTALTTSFSFSLVYGIVIALVLGIPAEFWARQFDADPMVISIAAFYLMLVPISYGAEGILMICTSAFNALGKPGPATVLSVMRMFVVYIPIALVAERFWGLNGIFAAALASNFLVGAIAFYWNRRQCFMNTPPNLTHQVSHS